MEYKNSFPDNRLLSANELNELFNKLYEGDKHSREIIINSNLGLVRQIVFKRFAGEPYDKSEIFSIGLLGLVKSVDSFDNSRGILFSTYAYRCIVNEITMFIRKNNKYKYDESIEKPVPNKKGTEEIKIIDTIEDPSSDFVSELERKEVYNIIDSLVNELPPLEKEIVSLYFGFVGDKCWTQKELSNKFGISQPVVSRIITGSLKKIENKLRRIGIIEKTTNSNKEVVCNLSTVQKINVCLNDYSINTKGTRLDRAEKNLIMKQLIEQLNIPELDKQIIKLYLGLVNNKRWRQYEIAKKFGFSKYYVSNSITNTLKQMKICLQEQGIIEMTEDKNSSVVKNDHTFTR